jgi:hypothetical protein
MEAKPTTLSVLYFNSELTSTLRPITRKKYAPKLKKARGLFNLSGLSFQVGLIISRPGADLTTMGIATIPNMSGTKIASSGNCGFVSIGISKLGNAQSARIPAFIFPVLFQFIILTCLTNAEFTRREAVGVERLVIHLSVSIHTILYIS